MSDQFNLPGFGPAPEPLPQPKPKPKPVPRRGPGNTLFFALYPGAADAARIARYAAHFRAENRLTGDPLLPDRLHVTLQPVAGSDEDFPPELIDAAVQAASRVALPPFEVVFNQVMSFSGSASGSRPVVLCSSDGAETIAMLQQHLGMFMKDQGLRATHGAMPHMTLLYDRNVVAKQAVEPLRWTASEFVLVHSHVGERWHEIKERWPLLPPL